MIAHRQARRLNLRLAESLPSRGKDFPRRHGMVEARASGDGAVGGRPGQAVAAGPTTALPAVGLGCTSLGMTTTSAHDKHPVLERKKSRKQNWLT